MWAGWQWIKSSKSATTDTNVHKITNIAEKSSHQLQVWLLIENGSNIGDSYRWSRRYQSISIQFNIYEWINTNMIKAAAFRPMLKCCESLFLLFTWLNARDVWGDMGFSSEFLYFANIFFCIQSFLNSILNVHMHLIEITKYSECVEYLQVNRFMVTLICSKPQWPSNNICDIECAICACISLYLS